MAGDWIKLEKTTARKPEVLAIATEMGIDPDHALGLVVRWFCWVDDHAAAPLILGCSESVLSSAFCPHFVRALSTVGWIKSSDRGVEVTNFDRHLSQTAKRRAVDAERKSASRKVVTAPESVRNMSRSKADKMRTREEKRRDTDICARSDQTTGALGNDPDHFFVAPVPDIEHKAAARSRLIPAPTEVRSPCYTFACELFHLTRAVGADCRYLWHVAAAVVSGRITEKAARSAGRASRAAKPRQVVAYFRTVLERELGAAEVAAILDAVPCPVLADYGSPLPMPTEASMDLAKDVLAAMKVEG